MGVGAEAGVSSAVMDATRAHGLLFELDSRALVLGMGVLPLASVSLSLPKDQALKAGRPLLAPRRRPARRLRGGETATAKPESSGAAAQAENPLQRVQAAIGGLFVLVLGRAQTLHPATRRLIAGGISGGWSLWSWFVYEARGSHVCWAVN